MGVGGSNWACLASTTVPLPPANGGMDPVGNPAQTWRRVPCVSAAWVAPAMRLAPRWALASSLSAGAAAIALLMAVWSAAAAGSLVRATSAHRGPTPVRHDTRFPETNPGPGKPGYLRVSCCAVLDHSGVHSPPFPSVHLLGFLDSYVAPEGGCGKAVG